MTRKTSDTFSENCLLECIREIEENIPVLLIEESSNNHLSFSDSIKSRAIKIKNQLNLSPLFADFFQLKQFIIYGFALFFFVLGLFSVQNVFFNTSNNQVNFFWSFTLFFIPNLFSLILWVFLFFKKNGLSNGWLARFYSFILMQSKLLYKFEKSKSAHAGHIFKTAFKLSFSGSIGRIQLSYLTHLIWFSYFLGAIFMALIKLATHQVDFMWETSLLSSGTFTTLTQLLTTIPSAIGLTVPNSAQIQQSHLGNLNTIIDTETLRIAWSTLLISSLVIYGALPRLLLLLIMQWRLKIVKKAFSVDLSHSYYLLLRQHIKPKSTKLGVVDEDTHPLNNKELNRKTGKKSVLPTLFYPVFLELPANQFQMITIELRKNHKELNTDLINLCDLNTQNELLSNLKKNSLKDIALYANLLSLPDRGVLRLITKIKDASQANLHLILVNQNQSPSIQKDLRMSDWYKLADTVNISFDNISLLDI